MTDEPKRGPGRPRRETVDGENDVIRQPLQTEDENPAKVLYDEAEARRRENTAIAQYNVEQELADQADLAKRQELEDKAAAKARKDAKRAYNGSTVEVLIVRKYVPTYRTDAEGDLVAQDNSSANPKEVQPGTTLNLPKDEAARAVKLGIAEITANSFG